MRATKKRAAEPSAKLTLPRRGRGRQSAEGQARYQRELDAFCRFVRQFASRLDFDLSARGWGYTLEGEGLITKDGIDLVENAINDARKSGALPLDICRMDAKREFANVEYVDDTTPQEEAQGIVDDAVTAYQRYRPFSFWEDQRHYVQCVTEKADLKSLFEAISAEFHIPIANVGGWGDLHVRAEMMERFAHWERRGKECVLLYIGDLDPGGLRISDFLRSNLQEMAGAVGWSPDNLIIDRIGLNRPYIDEHKLVWIDNLITGKKTGINDLNHPEHTDHNKAYVQDYIREHGVRKVEANAMLKNPKAARKWYREQICRYVAPTSPKRFAAKLRPHQDAVRKAVLRILRKRDNDS